MRSRFAGAALLVLAVQLFVSSAVAQTPVPTPSISVPNVEITPSLPAAPSPSPSSGGGEKPTAEAALTASAQEKAVVGENVSYGIVLKSVGTKALEDVLITDIVPAEVSIGAVVSGSPSATHTQVNRSLVWVVESLAPGKSITLRWTGTIARAGDLVARNRVVAESANAATASVVTTTVLKDTGATPGSSTGGASGASNGESGVAAARGKNVLPATGDASPPALLTAFALIVLGLLMLWFAGPTLVMAPLSETSKMPWVTVTPQGMRLWRMAEELREQAERH